MDEARITELRALANAATPGPWVRRGETWILGGPNGYDDVIEPAQVKCIAYCYGGSSRIELSDADATFIAAARTAIPELLDALTEAIAERDSVNAGYDAQVQHGRKHFERAEAAEAERDRLAGVVERVRALAEEWDEKVEYAERQTSVYVPPEEARDYGLYAYILTKRIGEVRAALEDA